MQFSNTQIVKMEMECCSFSNKVFFTLISERLLGKLVEGEVEVNDQISAEKRQKSERETVSCFGFLCTFKIFLSTDLENQ